MAFVFTFLTLSDLSLKKSTNLFRQYIFELQISLQFAKIAPICLLYLGNDSDIFLWYFAFLELKKTFSKIGSHLI